MGGGGSEVVRGRLADDSDMERTLNLLLKGDLTNLKSLMEPYSIDSELEDLKRRHPGAPLSTLVLDSAYTGYEDEYDPFSDEELPNGKRLPPREGWATRAQVVEALGISSSKFRYMENAGYLPRSREIRNHVKMYSQIQVECCYAIWRRHKELATPKNHILPSIQRFITATNPTIFGSEAT